MSKKMSMYIGEILFSLLFSVLLFFGVSSLFGGDSFGKVIVGSFWGLPLGSLMGVILHKKGILGEKINIFQTILGLVLSFILTICSFYLVIVVVDMESIFVVIFGFLITVMANVFLYDAIEMFYKKRKERQVQ
jgi:uncharacterized membrane protein YbhN (UPF0104 family)